MGLIRLTRIKEEKQEQYVDRIIVKGEETISAYKTIRDKFYFTTKRVIHINVQGITGSKKEYHSIPYKSISHFSVETAGTFDLDSELKIYISSQEKPIYHLEFKNDDGIYTIQEYIANNIL